MRDLKISPNMWHTVNTRMLIYYRLLFGQCYELGLMTIVFFCIKHPGDWVSVAGSLLSHSSWTQSLHLCSKRSLAPMCLGQVPLLGFKGAQWVEAVLLSDTKVGRYRDWEILVTYFFPCVEWKRKPLFREKFYVFLGFCTSLSFFQLGCSIKVYYSSVQVYVH